MKGLNFFVLFFFLVERWNFFGLTALLSRFLRKLFFHKPVGEKVK